MRGEEVLVIGASGKVGLAITKALAVRGYSLILQCRSRCEALLKLLSNLRQAGLTSIEAYIIRHDFLNEGVDSFLNKLRSKGLTNFSTVIISLGIYSEVGPNRSSEDLVRKVILTNLGTHVRLVEALPHLSTAEDLAILILTDVTPEAGPNVYSGLRPSLPYLAASAGVHALIKAAPYRLPRDTYVVGIALGWVEGSHLSDGLRALIQKTVPAGEPVRLDDVVNVIIKLCERDLPLKALNGSILRLSNGL